MSRETALRAVAAVLSDHGIREFDIGYWTCWCGPEERHDDPDRHFAEALQREGLLREES